VLWQDKYCLESFGKGLVEFSIHSEGPVGALGGMKDDGEYLEPDVVYFGWNRARLIQEML
jgi:hypothetical protein